MNTAIRVIFCAFAMTAACFAGKHTKTVGTCDGCGKRSEKYAQVDKVFISMCADIQESLSKQLSCIDGDAEFLGAAVVGPVTIGSDTVSHVRAACSEVITLFGSIKANAEAMRGNAEDSELFRILYRDVERNLARCIHVIVPHALAMANALKRLHSERLSEHFCAELDALCLKCQEAFDKLGSRSSMEVRERDLNGALRICRICRTIHNNH